MTSFLLYLFETGICLSLLFLIYLMFFQKETYFNFNRAYLIGVMVLSLTVPLIHITLHVNSLRYIEDPVSKIGKFRNYYTEIITQIDPEFETSPYISYERAVFEDSYLPNEEGKKQAKMVAVKTDPKQIQGINYARTLMLIYIAGVLFFLIRLCILTGWLFGIIRKNPKQKHQSYKIVLMKEDIPPFSFFRYVFINRNDTALNEYEQILTHEKVHVMQKHSLDLFLAHAFSVFQWFNPLAWRLQKAIKTTHEYIADRKVVSKGFELFDYQSLLLKQLVSIRSIDLVNNFNLLFIKKRITMMTKNKSGFPARLKAILIIPATLLVFFLFADMTVKSPAFSAHNFGDIKTSNFDGIWKNMNPNENYVLIQFKGNELSVLESLDNVNVRTLPITITDDRFVINRTAPGIENAIRYELDGKKLKIFWFQTNYSVYIKTDFKNSDEAFRPSGFKSMSIPQAKMAKVLDMEKFIIDIYVNKDLYVVGSKSTSQQDLTKAIASEINQYSILDRAFITARIHADENTPMHRIHAIKSSLRQLKSLKIAYKSYPTQAVSDLQKHTYAIPMKLPPPDAKLVDKEELGDRIFEFNASEDLSKVRADLDVFIDEHPDYIACFNWKNNTLYADYIAFVDMTFDVVYQKRDRVAMEKYQTIYSKLPTALQKEVRSIYPMRLTQTNTDEE